MSEQWYYGRGGKHAGPVDSAKLRSLAEAGDILPNDLVWKEGLEGWVAASSVTGLFPSGERISTNTGLPPVISGASAVHVHCTDCQAKYKVDEAAIIGNRVSCRACGNRIVVRTKTGSCGKLTMPTSLVEGRELNSDQLEFVRQRLSEFADEIPHHDIFDFGDSISISTSRLVPLYQVKLQTLFEERHVKDREEPFTNQDIPPTAISASDVDCWTTSFTPQRDFIEFQDEQRIEHSQTVHDCGACVKSGKVTCPECNGDSIVSCRQCNGSKVVNCTQCHGRGAVRHEKEVLVQKRCWFCNGTGRRAGLFAAAAADSGLPDVCQQCYGRLFYLASETQHHDRPCQACGTTGRVHCQWCQATGSVQCPTCHGTKRITCSRCDGHCQIVRYLSVVRLQGPALLRASICEDNDPVAEQQIHEWIGEQEELVVVESAQAESISTSLAEVPAAAGVPLLRKGLVEFLEQASSLTSDKRRIVWQSATVEQTIAATIQYRFAEQDYTAWLLGPEGQPLPLRTPFTDLVKSTLEAAITAWAGGHRKIAANSYCRCKAMIAKLPELALLLDENADRIPQGLKTAAATQSALVATKAKMITGAAKVADVVDAVKNSAIGKLFSRGKDEGEMRG